jgi:hypothetical protein
MIGGHEQQISLWLEQQQLDKGLMPVVTRSRQAAGREMASAGQPAAAIFAASSQTIDRRYNELCAFKRQTSDFTS